MPEKFDLNKMLEEIKADEKAETKKEKQVSQEEIRRLLLKRKEKK